MRTHPAPNAGEPGREPAPRAIAAALRVPLAAKLAGANALLVAVAIAAVSGGPRYGGGVVVAALAAVLAIGVTLNILLVHAALEPVRALERTVAAVARGDLAARVPRSALADPSIARVGDTLNVLLDVLGAERARVRRLAGEVIRAGDAERAEIARSLHDSAAQTLAALTLQAGSAARRDGVTADPALAEQLDAVRELSVEAMEVVRILSQSVHPAVLDDLGLAAALEQLARTARRGAASHVRVKVEGDARVLPPAVASTLYRIAEEAVGNAVRHGGEAPVEVRLTVGRANARLEVADAGRGFDPRAAALGGTGIFIMRERAALLDGRVEVESAPGRGTRVVAELPLRAAAAARSAASSLHPEVA